MREEELQTKWSRQAAAGVPFESLAWARRAQVTLAGHGGDLGLTCSSVLGPREEAELRDDLV